MMKILTGKEIKEIDSITMAQQEIDSLELMEGAAEVIAQWLCNNIEQGSDLLFFIGKGNNGGDGLAVARMLANVGFQCSVVMLFKPEELNEDCRANFERLPEGLRIIDIEKDQLDVDDSFVIIDAMLGSGVEGPAREPVLSAIELVNALHCRVISIDIPSGMPTEFSDDINLKIVEAETTLTIEFPKLSMLLPAFGEYSGKVEILSIGLSEEFLESSSSPYYYITAEAISGLTLPRTKFGHKNQYGHTLLVCGSRGMMGAAILATGGALRSGCGLVTAHIPAEERFALQASCPSAILSLDSGICFSEIPQNIEQYTSIGVGCGLGQTEQSHKALAELLRHYHQPMVLDADALNVIASDHSLRALIPAGSILTPHLGELKRLIPAWTDEQTKLEAIRKLSKELNSIIIVKGAHTMICTPNGNLYFNSTGCGAMAKGGCGDLLTGFISGLLARGYNSLNAAILGVYLHGVAGEKATAYYGEESMNSSDIIDFLAEAMVEI